MKIVIVGGVAGGASAAARLRRLNEKAEIIIFEKSSYISYANCGLPYYIGDIIKDESKLTLQTPESFFSRFRINVKVNHEVIDINPEKKEVTVSNLIKGVIFKESYDKLILAPGAKPIKPDFYKEDKRIFTLRTVEDALKIKSYITRNNPKSASIIGGGYVGVEMAENLKRIGLNVSIIQLDNQILNIIDNDMISFVHSTIKANNINLLLNSKVEDLIIKEKEIEVKINNILNGSNISINSDIVICAIGVIPDSKLAKLAGLDLGIKGAIKVNNKMQTSNPDIYAVGDVVEIKNYITKEEALISLAGPANKQGRIAADNICLVNSNYEGALGTSIIKVFDLTVACTGINEKECERQGLNYEKVILSPVSHASYYPESKVLTIKVLYEKESLMILGAQIVGYDGVDKRIDIIATAMKAKMKASDLKDLDLAYAPPYSQAKDPINLAGFIVDNIENGLVKQFHYNDLDSLRKRKDVILLDTRTYYEYNNGHAEGFMHIPLDELRDRLSELDDSKKIYVMCQSGLRSYIATRILVQYGYDAYNFSGGYRLYSSIYNNEKLIKEAYECGIDKIINIKH